MLVHLSIQSGRRGRTDMKIQALFLSATSIAVLALEAAANAGLAPPQGVPEPEVGLGIAAAVAVGAGYTWLKNRIGR